MITEDYGVLKLQRDSGNDKVYTLLFDDGEVYTSSQGVIAEAVEKDLMANGARYIEQGRKIPERVAGALMDMDRYFLRPAARSVITELSCVLDPHDALESLDGGIESIVEPGRDSVEMTRQAIKAYYENALKKPQDNSDTAAA